MRCRSHHDVLRAVSPPSLPPARSWSSAALRWRPSAPSARPCGWRAARQLCLDPASPPCLKSSRFGPAAGQSGAVFVALTVSFCGHGLPSPPGTGARLKNEGRIHLKRELAQPSQALTQAGARLRYCQPLWDRRSRPLNEPGRIPSPTRRPRPIAVSRAGPADPRPGCGRTAGRSTTRRTARPCAARPRGSAPRPKPGTPARRRWSSQTSRRHRRLTPAGRAKNYHRAWRGRSGWWW